MAAFSSIALGVGGALGAAGGIGGALIQKGAAEDAAEAQAAATQQQIAAQREAQDKAIAFAREQSQIAREELRPFREAQVGALGQLEQFAEGGSLFEQSQRSQATEAIQRQLAAQGLLRSGSQVRGLEGLETSLLGQRLNVLQGLAGTGAAQQRAGVAQGLGGQLSGIALQGGQQIGSSLGQLGQIQAQSILGGAQATAGALGSVNQAFQGTLAGFQSLNQQAQQQALVQRLLGGGGLQALQGAGNLSGLGLTGATSGIA